MDLNEIKNFFAENAEKDEVKSYLSELSQVSKEKESEIIEVFKKSKDYVSEIDRAVSKAVVAHDEKIKPKLEKELRDKIQLELNPPKDPAVLDLQKRLEELQQAQAEKDAALAQEKRLNLLHQTIAPEYKSFVKLFDGSIETDEEKAKFINQALFELQTKGTPRPPESGGSHGITRESLKNMSQEEIAKSFKEGKLDAVMAGK